MEKEIPKEKRIEPLKEPDKEINAWLLGFKNSDNITLLDWKYNINFPYWDWK